MKKNKFGLIIIVLGVLIIILGIAVGIKIATTEEEIIEKKSDEYIYYDERFNFQLSEDKSYYIITRFDPANTETTAEIPDTIDGIPVKKVLSNNDSDNFASWARCISIRIGKYVEYIGSETDNDGIKNGGTYGDGFFINSNSKTTTLIVDEENEVYASVDGVLYNKDLTILLRYPTNKISDKETFLVTIPDTVESIYNYAFNSNTNIQALTLGANVKSIGNYAFSNCEKLATITFNEKLETVGVAAFRDCNLTSIKLPNSITSLGNLSFAYNSSLSYCWIPENCKTFGSSVFNRVDKTFVISTTIEHLEYLQTVESLKMYNKKSE